MIRTQPRGGGWLEVVCGPMFSGKSEELIRRLRRAEIAGQRALIVKPLVDDRYDVGHVVSHAGARMRAVTAVSSGDVLRLAHGYDAVGIDEVQRLVGDRAAPFSGETVVIGALDAYEARCRACYQPGDDPAEAAGVALHSIHV